MAQQSLYRRYRPHRFAELRGQDHVSKALRHAVDSNSEGHAYLFSGPRGTGKTSTARILAKALNCTNLVDGEPCDVCDSCLAMNAGNSYDLFELDAASNNGVDAVRDLISRTSVGSPGRTKVYILDEVHMLSTAASNALLKTLEEPPEHVVFVLATTDPHKVLPTIKSRTQHFEFSLLSAEELTDYVTWVIADAGLAVEPDAIPAVVRQGRGSARDTLSALDRVVAAGGIDESSTPVDDLLLALGERNAGGAIAAVAASIGVGSEPRTIGEALLVSLRDAFLVAVAADTPHLTVDDRERAAAVGSRLGMAGLTRGLESIGSALVEMRQATDPRIPLEVAVVRLASPELDSSPAAIIERLDALERSVRAGGPLAVAGSPDAQAPPIAPVAPAVVSASEDDDGPGDTPDAADAPTVASPAATASGAAAARERLASIRQPGSNRPVAPARPSASPAPTATAAPAAPSRPGAAPPPRPSGSGSTSPSVAEPEVEPGVVAATAPAPAPFEAQPEPQPEPQPAPTAGDAPGPTANGALDVDAAKAALTDVVASHLKGAVRAIFAGGEVVDANGTEIVISFGNAPTLQRAEKGRTEVETALRTRLGTVTLTLIEGGRGGAKRANAGASASAPSVAAVEPNDDEAIDVTDLVDAPDAALSGVDRLVQAFPGAVVLDPDPQSP